MKRTERAICPVCGAEVVKVLGTRQGDAIREAFSIKRCPTCDCVYVADPVDSCFLPEIYNDAYFRGEGMDESVNYVENLERQNYFFEKYDWQMGLELAQYRLQPGVKWLDVGCAVGNNLDWAKDRYQAEVYGVEPSDYAAGIAGSRGHKIIGRTIGDVPADYDGYFNIVTAYEVMEHLYEPVDFIRNVSRLLKPGGIFHYSTGATPTDEAVLDWSYLRPEVHIIFYSPNCLRHLFRLGGLQPQRRIRTGENRIQRKLRYFQPGMTLKTRLLGMAGSFLETVGMKRIAASILRVFGVKQIELQPDGIKP